MMGIQIIVKLIHFKSKLINIDKYLKITRIIADIECLQISYLDDPNIVGNGDGNSLMENGDDKTKLYY